MKIGLAGLIIDGMIYCNSHRYESDVTREVDPEEWFTEYGWVFPSTEDQIVRRLRGFQSPPQRFTYRGALIRPGGEVYDIKYTGSWEGRVIIIHKKLPVMVIGINDDETVLAGRMLELIANKPGVIKEKVDINFINKWLENFVTMGKLVPWITTAELDKRLSKMTLKDLPY